MRIPRTLAIGTGVAILAISAMFASGTASAAVDGVTYVTSGELAQVFPALGPGSPSNSSWSDVSASDDTVTTTRGLLIEGDTQLTNIFEKQQEPSALASIAENSSFNGEGTESLRATIRFSEDGVVQNGILSAFKLGNNSWTNPGSMWTSNIDVDGRSAGTLAEFSIYFANDHAFRDATVFGAGFNTVGGPTYTLTDMTVNGTTYLFTPAPEPEFTPSPITPEEFVTTGFTVTTNGFLPGETVDVVLNDGSSASTSIKELTADPDGVVEHNYLPVAAQATTGEYTLSFVSESATATQFFNFSVVDALVVSEADVDALPATGANPANLITAAVTLTLVGAALLASAAVRGKRDKIA